MQGDERGRRRRCERTGPSPAAQTSPSVASDMSSGPRRGRRDESFSRGREPSVSSSRSENYWRRGSSPPGADRAAAAAAPARRPGPGAARAHVGDADARSVPGGDRDGRARVNARARERRRLQIEVQTDKQTLDRNNNDKVETEDSAVRYYHQFNPTVTEQEFLKAYNTTPATPAAADNFEKYQDAAGGYRTVIDKRACRVTEESSSEEEKQPSTRVLAADTPLVYRATQVITERTGNDAEKRIVWIYSYRNRHLFADLDGDTKQRRSSGNGDESTLENLGGRSGEVRPLWDKNYETQPCTSPRYPNLSCPIYIPSLDPLSTRRSLEPVEEGVESARTDRSERPASRHISEETLRSVNRWIDSTKDVLPGASAPEDAPGEPPAELNIELNLDPTEDTERERTGPVPRIKLTTRTVEEESCTIGRVVASARDVRWIGAGGGAPPAVRLGNTAGPGDDAGCRLLASSMLALRASPWSVYYGPASPRASDAPELSLGGTDAAPAHHGRAWGALSQWFCKCF